MTSKGPQEIIFPSAKTQIDVNALLFPSEALLKEYSVELDDTDIRENYPKLSADDSTAPELSNSKVYNSSGSPIIYYSSSKERNPADINAALSETAKELQKLRLDARNKTRVLEKGSKAAEALAVIAGIIASALLAALITPSEVIFTNLDTGIYRYSWCHADIQSPANAQIASPQPWSFSLMLQDRDGICQGLRTTYAITCVIALIFDLLALLATMVVVIGAYSWLAYAYSLFILSILVQSLALITALWLAFPYEAAVAGTILMAVFLVAATLFVMPGIALAWHFNFGGDMRLVLENSARGPQGNDSPGDGPEAKKGRTRAADVEAIEGTTVLHWAAFKGGRRHRLLLDVLLAAGESVDSRAAGADGWTPLMIASYIGNLTIVRQLLKAGADITIEDISHGRTALHWAASKGRSDVVEELLRAGADPVVQDVVGSNAKELAEANGHDTVTRCIDKFINDRLHRRLLTAVKRKDTAKVTALLAAELDPNKLDEHGNTALHWAANRGSLEITRDLILAKADMNKRNHGGSTPLREAALMGAAAVAELLLRHGADPELPNNEKETPLMAAAKRGNTEVIKVLLNVEAKVDDRVVNVAAEHATTNSSSKAALMALLTWEKERRSCKSVLQAAALLGSYPAVNYLLDNGHRGDIWRADTDGTTPLHAAAESGSIEIAEALLNAGTEINRRDNSRRSPLHWAASEGHADLVRVLLDRGADVNAIDNEGSSPMTLAESKGQAQVMDVFRSYRDRRKRTHHDVQLWV